MGKNEVGCDWSMLSRVRGTLRDEAVVVGTVQPQQTAGVLGMGTWSSRPWRALESLELRSDIIKEDVGIVGEKMMDLAVIVGRAKEL